MTLQLNKPLIFFDLETTGINTTHDRIVEISYIKLFPNGTTEEKTYVILGDSTQYSVELKGDSLVLIDWCYDCFYHHFHRQ